MPVWKLRRSGFMRSMLTLLMGGVLAQLLPLALGPVLSRLFSPEAFGVLTVFTTLSAVLTVLACLRYEFALPLADSAHTAYALLCLCVRILALSVLLLALCAGMVVLCQMLTGWRMQAVPMAVWLLLPWALASAGGLQLLVMWNNRMQAFRVMAISRVLQYGGAALVQVAGGLWLWWQGATPAQADSAWVLMLGPVLACGIAWIPLLTHAPDSSHAVPSMHEHNRSDRPARADAAGQVTGCVASGARVCAVGHTEAKPVSAAASVCPHRWGSTWRQWAGLMRPATAAQRQAMRDVARQYRDFPLLNTPHAFLGMLQDVLAIALLVAYTGQAEAGFWGLALRYLKAPASLVGSAVSQVLYTRLAALDMASGRRLVRQVMLMLAVPAVVLMVILLLAAPWLFVWLFGLQWLMAGYLAQALAPYIAAHFVAAPLAVVTMAWNAQRWALRLALVGQVLFVLALAAGLWWGGLLAGAWCVSAVMVVYFGWYFWRLLHWRDMPASSWTGVAVGEMKEEQS